MRQLDSSHATARTGRRTRSVAVEQFPLIRLWRSRGGSPERLAVVAAEATTARGLSVLDLSLVALPSPHFSQRTRKNGAPPASLSCVHLAVKSRSLGFESACKRKTKDLQRTGSNHSHCKYMKKQEAGFRGFSLSQLFQDSDHERGTSRYFKGIISPQGWGNWRTH